MDFGLASYATGMLAGGLSILSPCVLPVVPVLLGTAASVDRRGPLALASGLALSFAIIGTVIAALGARIGFDVDDARTVAALVLAVLGLALISTRVQHRFAKATAGIGNAGNGLLTRWRLDGLGGQFAIGLLLGIVWSPCVGPTLGAAVMLASQGAHLPEIVLMMALFGLGAALPVVALGFVSRRALVRSRGALLMAGRVGKSVMGIAMLCVALLILTRLDRQLEAWLVDHSPDWLTTLTTRY